MWPFTKRQPAEKALKERLAGHVMHDRGLQSALQGVGGIPRGLELRAVSDSHIVTPFRFGDRSFRLHFWCPFGGRDEALDTVSARELMGGAGLLFPPTLHLDISGESAERTGVWCLLEEETPATPLTPDSFAHVEVISDVAGVLSRLHGHTSSLPGRPWRGAADPQSWSRWAAERAEALLSGLQQANPDRIGGVSWLRERFAERRQPDEVFTPFNLTLGTVGLDGLGLTEEGEIQVLHPERARFAPFECDLAAITLDLSPERAEALIEAYLSEHAPRERQRVHLNLGPLRAFAALGRAHETEGWERLLRIAEQDL